MNLEEFFKQQYISGMEFIWALLALISLLLGIYATFTDGITQSYPLFIIALIAVGMYFLRRRMRKKQWEEDQ